MIRLNTPIEALILNLQSAGDIHYNITYTIVRNGTSKQETREGLLTTIGDNEVLLNDFSSGYFEVNYISVTNVNAADNFISVLKRTQLDQYNLTSQAIGIKFRESIEYTAASGWKVLDANGQFKTITESVDADADVQNSDMSYMVSVASGGTLVLPDSDVEVNGSPQGPIVSVKTVEIELSDGTDPVNPTFVLIAGNLITITLPDIGDVTVENSDATYSVVEPSGGTLTLPDSQINVNGVDEGDVVSVKTIDVNITDGTDPVVPTSIDLTGNVLTIEVPTGGGGGDVDIEINGVAYDTITAPATVDIPVINSVPAAVGTIVGTDVVIADSSAVIKNSAGTTLKTEAIAAEASENITINDSTAVIKDSAGTTLKSEGILAEASENITINDSVAVIKDSANVTIKSENILAEATENITINDSTVNVRKSDSTLISAVSVKAEATTSYNVADSSAVLKDEDGNILSTTSIKATESEDIVAPNGDVTVNSTAFDDVLSGGTLDIEVRKSTGNDLIGSKQGQYWRIGDSTAVIKNSAGTTLKSENIKATESENITINDSTAVIKDSAGTTIKSEGILAEASENITINDSVAVLKDSANVTLDTVNLLAEETKNITLDDFNVEVEDPLGSVILTDSYLAYSENTLNLTALASTMVVVGTGITLTISPTAPLTPSENDIWLQPI